MKDMKSQSLKLTFWTVAIFFTAMLAWDQASASVRFDEFTFRFSAEELTDRQGADRVYNRLKREAGRYCRSESGEVSGMRKAQIECRESVVDAVVRRIGDRTLRERHLRDKRER